VVIGNLTTETTSWDAHFKVHDNTAEASFQADKLRNAWRHGVGHRNKYSDSVLVRSWMWETDWKNHFTDMSFKDCVKVFLQHVALMFPCEHPDL